MLRRKMVFTSKMKLLACSVAASLVSGVSAALLRGTPGMVSKYEKELEKQNNEEATDFMVLFLGELGNNKTINTDDFDKWISHIMKDNPDDPVVKVLEQDPGVKEEMKDVIFPPSWLSRRLGVRLCHSVKVAKFGQRLTKLHTLLEDALGDHAFHLDFAGKTTPHTTDINAGLEFLLSDSDSEEADEVEYFSPPPFVNFVN